MKKSSKTNQKAHMTAQEVIHGYFIPGISLYAAP